MGIELLKAVSTSPRSIAPVFVYIALALGIAAIGVGIMYFTINTSFLADDFGKHSTHGAASTGVGIALIVGGIVGWRRTRKVVAH